MGRAPCCDKANVKRGPWSPEEDRTLKSYVEKNGSGGNWIALPQKAGLKRCGKSCRLRWLNYLRPDIKHGGFTEEEDAIISTLYEALGSRWSVIASHLKGRTDNDVKNYWNTKLKKKSMAKQINRPVEQTHVSTPVSPQIPMITSESSSYEQSQSTISNSNSNSNSNSGFFVDSELSLIVSPNQSRWYSGSSAAASSSITVDNFGGSGGSGDGFADGFFSDLGFLSSSLDNLDWNHLLGEYRVSGDQECAHSLQQEFCRTFTSS